MQRVLYNEGHDETRTPPNRISVSVEARTDVDGKNEGIDNAIKLANTMADSGFTGFDLRVREDGFTLDIRFDDRKKAVAVFKSLGGK